MDAVISQLNNEFGEVWSYAASRWGGRHVALAQHQFIYFCGETDDRDLLNFCEWGVLAQRRENGWLDEDGGSTSW
tara:strand:+ start:578 stop:802 length:225 start_codon:yes stop_codon:yes gene_type:complete